MSTYITPAFLRFISYLTETRVTVLLVLMGLIIIPFFSSSSASSSKQTFLVAPALTSGQISAVLAPPSAPSFGNILTALMPQNPQEGIETYAADCATPRSDFALGETVCVKATGPVDQSLVRRRVQLVNPEFLIADSSDLLTSPQNITFTLPSSATETVNGVSVDNRGTWLVKLVDTSNASARQVVHLAVRDSDPARVIADLQINTAGVGDTHPTAGSTFDVLVWVFNSGPQAAQNVSFTDTSPANTTFQSLIQPLSFNCVTPGIDSSGTTTCTKSSMAKDEAAGFIFTYKVNTAVADGTGLTSTATVSSSTDDNRDESNTADTSVTGSNPTPPACTLTCPDNILVDANDTQEVNGVPTRGAIVTFDSTSSGSCGTVSGTPGSGSFFPVGTTSVAVSATGASCSFSVTVADAAPPTISCPADQNVTAANGECSATVTPGTPSATGDGVTVQGSRSDGRALTDAYPSGETTITWTATDSSGRTATCGQTINVSGTDTTAPVPAVDPLPTITASCTASADVPTANDSCNGSIGGTTSDPRTYDSPGTYTIHWTYTDASGNSSTQNQTVIVTADSAAPTITHSAGNVTINADAGCAITPDLTAEIAATDNCTTVEVTQSPAPGTTLGSGDTTVTFTATDTANNSTTSTAVITVVDNTAPTITLNGAATMTVECHASFTDPGATANDNCAGATVTSTGAVDANTPGVYTITYNATDAAGNDAVAVSRTVNVVDTTPPTINCPAGINVSLPANSTATSVSLNPVTPTASDSCATAVAVTGTRSDGQPLNASYPVGATTITWRATDASGNYSECTQTVQVSYLFTGFFAPVSNSPTLNVVNAGRGIPVKFSLSGDKGLNIFAADSPFTIGINCDGTAPQSEVAETLTAGGSSLSYQSSSDQYNYVWKTEGSWAGTCRQLVVKLNDGTEHRANFKFK